MSSDESDYDELEDNPPSRLRAPRYYILRPKWRAEALSEWLQTFDAIYSIIRRTTMSRRGAYSHQRQQNGQRVKYSSQSSFVPDLPASAYDPVWLQARVDVDFAVRPVTTPFNFTHEPNVYQ